MVLLCPYIHQNLSKCVQNQRNPDFVQVYFERVDWEAFRVAGNISDDTNTVTSFIKKCTEDMVKDVSKHVESCIFNLQFGLQSMVSHPRTQSTCEDFLENVKHKIIYQTKNYLRK